ncbi:type II toxin-antitoxin system VapB family antitoxin [Methylobacterium nonmethylotrophicum]|uniref:Transcription factor n=1 Tax=Methylobacterium nonmethylotrophicum TaxID=1141884 RepID=A0A4Z0NMM2_9HYPH|nr:type II toxin-antitoxin system VapB family antitoxin [Methylobacterium nonmethylotrophicum]TGD97119.1 transcription factor [Methylobacterium nonmethylotrophicum]
MALFVKDPEVDALAQELASLKRVTKTEAVRQALRGALDRERGERDLVAQSIAFARGLRERAGPNPRPADKAFLDGLYGDP